MNERQYFCRDPKWCDSVKPAFNVCVLNNTSLLNALLSSHVQIAAPPVLNRSCKIVENRMIV